MYGLRISVKAIAAAIGFAGLSLLPFQAAAQDPVKIGVTMPLTGNLAFDGQNAVKGMEIAIDAINEAGGILGRQVELVVLDDKSNPEEGVNAVKRLIADEKVNALATAMTSSVGLAQVDATAGRILHVVVMASAPAITEKGYKNVFRVNTTFASKEDPLIDMVKAKVQSVAMLATNDDYGRGVVDMYKKAWGEEGPKITSEGFVQINETDLLPYLTRIRFEQPDGLMLTLMSSQLATAMKQAKQIGLTPEVFWTSGGGINPTLLKLGGESVNGLVASDNYVPASTSEANQLFLDRLAKRYPEDPPQLYHAVAYDAIMVIAEAMNAAGTADEWEKIAEAMHEVSYDSPRGPLTFDEKGQVALAPFLVQVVDGKMVELE